MMKKDRALEDDEKGDDLKGRDFSRAINAFSSRWF
jgi:hypothetical protein